MGWGCQAKKCSLKSLSSAHVKPSDKILLLTAKSFLFWCCYLHWKVKCRMSSKVREADYVPCSRCPLLTFGSVWFSYLGPRWPLWLQLHDLKLCWSFLPYIKCIYQISKTNGQWQRNLNEFVKWRKKKKKKTFLVCARHCHHNNNRIRTHTNTQIQVKTVLSINNRPTALWWHLIPSIAFLLLMVWGASTHCLADIGKLVDTHGDTRTPFQPNICCF